MMLTIGVCVCVTWWVWALMVGRAERSRAVQWGPWRRERTSRILKERSGKTLQRRTFFYISEWNHPFSHTLTFLNIHSFHFMLPPHLISFFPALPHVCVYQRQGGKCYRDENLKAKNNNERNPTVLFRCLEITSFTLNSSIFFSPCPFLVKTHDAMPLMSSLRMQS